MAGDEHDHCLLIGPANLAEQFVRAHVEPGLELQYNVWTPAPWFDVFLESTAPFPREEPDC